MLGEEDYLGVSEVERRGGKPFYWTDIRKNSSVKKKNLQSVVPYLTKYTDDYTVEIIMELVSD